MSLTPQGKSIQTLYKDYRDGNLLVNRKYQRKLVWTVEEKRELIDSIINGFPIPLILLAEPAETLGSGKYEIIDGIQRLNAIFTFIENTYDYQNKYFDVNQFARANQLAQAGVFTASRLGLLLEPEVCANILDYQLAVTIYPAGEDKITEVFGRINSNGRQLSSQEKRQAGVTSMFCELVRNLSAELRGDVSKDVLLLSEMPEISIDTATNDQGYGVKAEDTLWVRQGILSRKQLRDSEDEQMVADIAASILREEPLAVSQELLDSLYEATHSNAQDIERRLITYGADKLASEIKATFSILKRITEEVDPESNALRTIVRPKGRYPIKTPFYAIFMALFNLIVKQKKSPSDSKAILNALHNLDSKLKTSGHYETTANRVHNINLTKGLIQDYFVYKEPPVLGHGPSLLLDFENSLRRSKIENSRYEFKQGILKLDTLRTRDNDLLERLIETVCGIANLGKDSTGYIYLGVADKKQDADRIVVLDSITPKKVAYHYVVGIDREALILGLSLDEYVRNIVSIFQHSELSEPLKTQVLANFDTITIGSLTVIRIVIPTQREISFVGDHAYYREGSSTKEATGQKIIAIARLFD